MTTITEQDFTDSIRDGLQYISYYHPPDFIRAMTEAWEREESPAAKDAMAQILINSRMCAEGHRPICQDTGIVNVFLEIERQDEPAAKGLAGFATRRSLPSRMSAR